MEMFEALKELSCLIPLILLIINDVKAGPVNFHFAILISLFAIYYFTISL